VTTVPLLLVWCSRPANRLEHAGSFTYIAPTLQFLIGVLVYQEPFNAATLVGFCIIWTALAILWGEGMIDRQRR